MPGSLKPSSSICYVFSQEKKIGGDVVVSPSKAL